MYLSESLLKTIDLDYEVMIYEQILDRSDF